MTPLFRPEALESRHQSWLGGIQLVQPLRLTMLTALAAFLAALAFGYLVLGEYTRKARVQGVLVPERGVIRILAPNGAGASVTVLERPVREGQQVKRGDVLYVLSLDRASTQGDTQPQVLQSMVTREQSLQAALAREDELLKAQLDAVERRIAQQQRELAQIDSEAALHAKRLALAREALARLESLRADHFISAAQVQTKAEDVLAVQAQAQALARQKTVLQRDLSEAQARKRELPMHTQTRRGEVERDLAALGQASAESEALRRLVVRCPEDGVLSAVVAEVGQSVSGAAALASLVPKSSLQAHLYAPSSAVGFVRADQKVQIRLQAFPYQKYGHQAGHVLQVSRTPQPANEVTALAIAPSQNEPLYRINVALDQQNLMIDGQTLALVPGMQLEADVLLERRRLIEWLFEPLFGALRKV